MRNSRSRPGPRGSAPHGDPNKGDPEGKGAPCRQTVGIRGDSAHGGPAPPRAQRQCPATAPAWDAHLPVGARGARSRPGGSGHPTRGLCVIGRRTCLGPRRVEVSSALRPPAAERGLPPPAVHQLWGAHWRPRVRGWRPWGLRRRPGGSRPCGKMQEPSTVCVLFFFSLYLLFFSILPCLGW